MIEGLVFERGRFEALSRQARTAPTPKKTPSSRLDVFGLFVFFFFFFFVFSLFFLFLFLVFNTVYVCFFCFVAFF